MRGGLGVNALDDEENAEFAGDYPAASLKSRNHPAVGEEPDAGRLLLRAGICRTLHRPESLKQESPKRSRTFGGSTNYGAPVLEEHAALTSNPVQ